MSGLALTVLLVASIALSALTWRAHRKLHLVERLVADQSQKLERIQTAFGRFAPADVVDHLSDPTGPMAPARRDVTVMFADLRGFTPLSERMDPADMVGILNGYFEAMTEAITMHHGRVTQFIGDGLLALFGALEPDPWQAQDAVKAALDMRRALARYNEDLCARGFPALAFGVGIHCGEVVAGVIGNSNLSTFSVVGDTVNTASRVEQLTRSHDVDVLITESVRAKLDARYTVREFPAALVKGKEQPIVTYHVIGMHP
jgi:adenylate cyclase